MKPEDMSVINLTLDFGSPNVLEIEFTFGGVDYVLVEASGGVKADHENAILRCAKVVDGKPTSAEGIGDIEPQLVAGCLFIIKDGKRMPVTLKQVRDLPGRVVRELATKLKTMSGLDQQDTVESLRNQIEALTRKLAQLESGGSDAKN